MAEPDVMAELNVIVAGAGIAGLTCSIALARHKGVKVTILERFSDIGPVRFTSKSIGRDATSSRQTAC